MARRRRTARGGKKLSRGKKQLLAGGAILGAALLFSKRAKAGGGGIFGGGGAGGGGGGTTPGPTPTGTTPNVAPNGANAFPQWVDVTVTPIGNENGPANTGQDIANGSTVIVYLFATANDALNVGSVSSFMGSVRGGSLASGSYTISITQVFPGNDPGDAGNMSAVGLTAGAVVTVPATAIGSVQ